MAVETRQTRQTQRTPPDEVTGGWRALVLAPVGDGQRRRRGSDGVRLTISVLATICAVLVIQSNSHPEQVIAGVLSPPPNGVRWLVKLVWIAGSFGTVAALLLIAALSRRWNVLRDLGVAAIGSLAACGVVILFLGTSGGRPHTVHIAGYSLSFPVIQIAVAVSIATAGLPYLARSVQRLIEAVLFLTVLATVVGGQGLPVNVLGSMAIGWGVTAALHLGFGSPLGLPSGDEVRASLASIGITPKTVVPAPHQTWGVAHYVADMDDSDALLVSLYGRDATEAQLLTKIWRRIFYRNSGPAFAVTRIQQVEHESSITQLAARAGARVPEVLVASTLGPSHDAVLISGAPKGNLLVDTDPAYVTDAHLDDLFAQMMTLRGAAISHGAISQQAVVVDPANPTATIVDFRRGTSAASEFVLDQDLAGAIASAALTVGPERAAASAVRVVPAEPLDGALSHLRRAGLDFEVIVGLKGKKELLEQLRTEVANKANISLPDLVEPRRFSWTQVLVAVGTLVGGWALILTLINASHSIDTIRSAEWGWVIATLILCGATYLGTACSDVGSVPGALPYGRAIALELANTFTALAGGRAAVIATDVRFYQEQGYSSAAAVTSGALISTASLMVKGVLFVIAIPVAWHSFHFGNSLHQGNHSKLLVIIVAVFCVIGVAMIVIVAVPRWRQNVSEKLRNTVASLKTNLQQLAGRPSNIVALIGGQIVAQLATALALGTALHAFGAHLSVAALVIAVTVAGSLASVSPAGGGMGVAEASLILCLTAAGVGKNDATAAVFIQRLFSAYLPPIVGWLTLMWMRKREYL